MFTVKDKASPLGEDVKQLLQVLHSECVSLVLGLLLQMIQAQHL